MAKEERRISPAVAIIPIGLGLAVVGALAALAFAAPGPPGLAILYGKVTDANTGQPIPNALITISRGGDSVTIMATTEGLFGVQLTPGPYHILIEKEGYESVAQEVVLHEGDNVLDVELVPIPPPGMANLYGKVTDAVTVAAISGVLVSLNGLEVYTDAGGNYMFEDLDPGSYVLQFSKENYETATY